MEEEMEELCAEGLPTRGDPSHASTTREGVATCDSAAGGGPGPAGIRSVDSRTCRPAYRAAKSESGVPTLSMRRKATLLVALARIISGPRAVKEPGQLRNLHAPEPGVAHDPAERHLQRRRIVHEVEQVSWLSVRCQAPCSATRFYPRQFGDMRRYRCTLPCRSAQAAALIGRRARRGRASKWTCSTNMARTPRADHSARYGGSKVVSI